MKINWTTARVRGHRTPHCKIRRMQKKALVPGTEQLSSLQAIRWAVAVERERLTAAIDDATREVVNAQRLLALDVDGAARSLDSWKAILDSRLTRLQSFELRRRKFEVEGLATAFKSVTCRGTLDERSEFAEGSCSRTSLG